MTYSLNTPDDTDIATIRTLVGEQFCFRPDRLSPYLFEQRTKKTGNAALIVCPPNKEAVQRIVQFCHDRALGIIPYGGGTGLAGGQVDIDGGQPEKIVLSMENLNTLNPVNQNNQSIACEAGCLLKDVKTAAQQENLIFPLSMASQDVCTIGGNLATNAGGLNVIRYGSARQLCIGLEAVLANGRIFCDSGNLLKDNSGYDIRSLIIGSEGTLGIITAATLRLFTTPCEKITVFCTIPEPASCVRFLRAMQKKVHESMTAFELLSPQNLQMVSLYAPHISIPVPIDRYAVLIEVSGYPSIADVTQKTLKTLLDDHTITEAFVAQNGTQEDNFWKIRTLIPSANRFFQAIVSCDIALPIEVIPDFLKSAELTTMRIFPERIIGCFGHIGDGNLHYSIFAPQKSNVSKTIPLDRLRTQLMDSIYELVIGYRGTISGEHGIGRLKRELLHRYADPVKIHTMQAIKKAFDPKGILNPNVFF
jgi:FAD/FMN-containing dehydrogenase